jgi:hypothetical protein
MCLSIHQSVELQASQRLGEDLGADASDPRAGLLEATAALFIALWVGEEADVQAIAPPLAYAGGPSREQAEGGQRSFC